MFAEVRSMSNSPIDRFADPLYTRAEAARFLGVKESTFNRWARETNLVTTLEVPRGEAAVPFIGLAEAYALHAFRALKVPLQRIRPALDALAREFGLEHTLASQRLYTDGAEVLYDYRSSTGEDADDLVVVRHNQPVFRDVVRDHLKRVEYVDGYAQRLPLLGYNEAELFVDPRRAFGQPVFARGGARLADALDLFRAGEPFEVVAAEFGIPENQMQAVLRTFLPAAA